MIQKKNNKYSPIISFQNIQLNSKYIELVFAFKDEKTGLWYFDIKDYDKLKYFEIYVSNISRNWNYKQTTPNWPNNYNKFFSKNNNNNIDLKIPCNLYKIKLYKRNHIKLKFIENNNIIYISIVPVYNDDTIGYPSEELIFDIDDFKKNMTIDELYTNFREVGLYYSKWAIKYCNINNSFDILKKLIKYCKNNKYFNNVDLLNINNTENNKINIAFRCDIDCDIYTAKKMSNLFKNNKIKSTFFVLHTTNYYRKNDNYPIERCHDLKENILDIHNDYCSIGLHLDPLHVYINLNNDGSEEVLNEINWLKSFINIKSICAHNSYYVYGAENFEIFKELAYNSRKFLNYENKKIPLSTLSLQELKLTEINYPIIKKDLDIDNIELLDDTWSKYNSFKKAVYDNEIFASDYDINIWCVGKDEWLISNIKKKYFSIENFDFVLDYLDNLNNETINNIVFNLHPIYFSL